MRECTNEGQKNDRRKTGQKTRKKHGCVLFDPDPFCFLFSYFSFFVVSLYALRFIAIYCIIDEIL